MPLNDINKRMCAVELFSSAACNLNCTYCYIPKTNKINNYHKKILSHMEDGTFIKYIEKVFGRNLKYLSLWGGEQTIILDRFVSTLHEYFKVFTELEGISFSSNLIAYTHRIIELSDKMEKLSNRPIELNWQVSIDGPKWINDSGRGEGSTAKILTNIDKYFDMLCEREYKKVRINFQLKPTLGAEFIEKLNKDFNLLVEWYKFFDGIIGKINEKRKNMKVVLATPSSISPTLVVPGKYTSYDGKQLALFFKNIEDFTTMNSNKKLLKNISGPFNEYVNRLKIMFRYINDPNIIPANMACSGGDTQHGLNIDGNIIPCHRLFLFDNKDYIDSIYKDDNDYENWDVSKFNRGIVNNINRYLTVNAEANEKEINRYFYTTRSFHDFMDMRIANTYGQIKELALIGQASEVYLRNEPLVRLLSIFINTLMSCPIENYLQTGSLHNPPVSIIRLFANGAFEQMYKSYLNLEERG